MYRVSAYIVCVFNLCSVHDIYRYCYTYMNIQVYMCVYILTPKNFLVTATALLHCWRGVHISIMRFSYRASFIDTFVCVNTDRAWKKEEVEKEEEEEKVEEKERRG